MHSIIPQQKHLKHKYLNTLSSEFHKITIQPLVLLIRLRLLKYPVLTLQTYGDTSWSKSIIIVRVEISYKIFQTSIWHIPVRCHGGGTIGEKTIKQFTRCLKASYRIDVAISTLIYKTLLSIFFCTRRHMGTLMTIPYIR